MNSDPLLLAFSTSDYDAMIRFLREFGFTVNENPHGDQLVPFYEHGRGARVSRGNFEFQLEESDSPAKAAFNIFLSASDDEIARLRSLGYRYEYRDAGPYGEFHTFHSPDGGKFVFQ
jgi:hypothetical protein